MELYRDRVWFQRRAILGMKLEPHLFTCLQLAQRGWLFKIPITRIPNARA